LAAVFESGQLRIGVEDVEFGLIGGEGGLGVFTRIGIGGVGLAG